MMEIENRIGERGGFIVVEEDFEDENEEVRIDWEEEDEKIVVIKYLGKLFGMEGIRMGLDVENEDYEDRLRLRIGKWEV